MPKITTKSFKGMEIILILYLPLAITTKHSAYVEEVTLIDHSRLHILIEGVSNLDGLAEANEKICLVEWFFFVRKEAI